MGTEHDFKAFFLEHFEGEKALDEVDWDKWLYGPGMPDVPPIASKLAEQAEMLCASLLGGYDGSPDDIKGWIPSQTMLLLDLLTAKARKAGNNGELSDLRKRLDRW